MIAGRTAAALAYIGAKHRRELRPDRDETALVELRGTHGQDGFSQIDVRQAKARRLTEAQPGPVQQDK